MKLNYSQQQQGFTLIELLVIIGIIGLLAGIILISLASAKNRGADAKRKADIVQLQKALENYYNDFGGYPLTTNGALPTPVVKQYGVNSSANCFTGPAGSRVDSGQKCNQLSGAYQYIPGLSPNYVGQLPQDPTSGNGSDGTGYVYKSDGSSYKITVYGTPYSIPSSGQDFYNIANPSNSWMVTNNPSVTSSW